MPLLAFSARATIDRRATITTEKARAKPRRAGSQARVCDPPPYISVEAGVQRSGGHFREHRHATTFSRITLLRISHSFTAEFRAETDIEVRADDTIPGRYHRSVGYAYPPSA